MKKIWCDAKRIIWRIYIHTYIIFAYNGIYIFFYGPDIGSMGDGLSQLTLRVASDNELFYV